MYNRVEGLRSSTAIPQFVVSPFKVVDGVLATVLENRGAGVAHTAYINQIVDYYPYGDTRIQNQYYTHNQTKRFTGHTYDEATNLYYMGARYQNPETGRFVSQDPAFLALGNAYGVYDKTNLDMTSYLSDPQGMNSYSYARNNPIVFVDKSGEYFETAFDVAMLSLSVNAYRENPGFWNGVGVVADGISLIAPIPAVVGALRHGDDAYKAFKVAQDVSKANNWGNPSALTRHAREHAADFGLQSDDISGYAKAANNFISNADSAFKQGSTRYDSFVGKDGKSYFFDKQNSTFGVRNADGSIATAYKPKGGDSQKAQNYWNNKKRDNSID